MDTSQSDLINEMLVTCQYGIRKITGLWNCNKTPREIIDSYNTCKRLYDFDILDTQVTVSMGRVDDVTSYQATLDSETLQRWRQAFQHSPNALKILTPTDEGVCHLPPVANMELVFEYASLLDTELRWELESLSVDGKNIHDGDRAR